MKTQPKRKPQDGAINVRRHITGNIDEGDYIEINCVTNCVMESVSVGEYNAWRLFAALALILGVDLPKKLLKSIRM